MDNENLDTLLENAFSAEAEETTPAGDNSQQETQQQESTAETAEQAEQPSEERSRNAQRRRNREERIAREAREAARAEMSATLASLGIENPDSGAVIGTVDELEAYAKSLSDQRIASGRANEADMRRIASEVVRAQSDSGANGEADRQLELIREMDPNMKDLGAILQSDIGEAFKREVQSGASFVQAYGRAVRERTARTDGARASEAAKTAGKTHMTATRTLGTGGLDVPSDELEMFRELVPGATDAEIREFYNRDKKRIK